MFHPIFLALRSCAPLLLAALLALAGACSRTGASSVPPAAASPARRVQQHVARELARLHHHVQHQLLPLARRGTAPDSLRRSFRVARLLYKRVEPFTEYYMPGTARLLNGPPIGEVEVAENKDFEPGGLQVLETLLYPRYDSTSRAELVREVKAVQREISNARTRWQVQELSDAHVFDVLRLQVFRVVALGITGFDTPLSPAATFPETAAALAALQPVLACYEPARGAADSVRAAYATAGRQLRRAEQYAHRHPDFADFDRLAFIRDYANPLGQALLACQVQLGIRPFEEVRALRPDAATLFDSAAFNPDFYAPTTQHYRTEARVALGRQLFHDPVLSGSGGRSCASCHQPDKAFTDGLTKNITLTPGGLVQRNTPTILNAALQAGQFYDLRSATLENQAADVVGNPNEMHGSLEAAARRLQLRPAYVRQFRQAFPGSEVGAEPTAITPVQIQTALAAYERTLVRLNSRFDQHIRGQREALSREEIRGFNVFMGAGKCGTCHFAPLFNGTVPPGFTEAESEVLGIEAAPKARRLDADQGRYAQVQLPQLRRSFKIPTVRNVALTAPYMHNGAYRTLEQVIEFYNEGGGQGRGLPVPNQTLPPDKLHLSAADQRALKAFLLALTDTAAVR
ncbi:cytochrome-c peroxidase [Hymenobacter metallilatus]|uniref:Cytochrome C peroxidase n=1 Tax=Hymenobacter metallilatus TaxID=2493666 RepID=A0A428JMF5_9BACT|nr:cytochrome c peroxidase [Hymenobacter metallilatus]RSK34467.1 cytochrome C peroxidase [Hymenobacter metallilatus]